MPTRLSDINFERFSDVEIHDVFDGLVDFGITPLIALADVVEEETHAAFANSVINEIQAKLEDLETTIERLAEQWDQGRLKPSRIKKFGEETEAKLESLLKGDEPDQNKEPESDDELFENLAEGERLIPVRLRESCIPGLKAVLDFLDDLPSKFEDPSSQVWVVMEDLKKQRPELFKPEMEKKEASETPTKDTSEASE